MSSPVPIPFREGRATVFTLLLRYGPEGGGRVRLEFYPNRLAAARNLDPTVLDLHLPQYQSGWRTVTVDVTDYGEENYFMRIRAQDNGAAPGQWIAFKQAEFRTIPPKNLEAVNRKLRMVWK